MNIHSRTARDTVRRLRGPRGRGMLARTHSRHRDALESRRTGQRGRTEPHMGGRGLGIGLAARGQRIEDEEAGAALLQRSARGRSTAPRATRAEREVGLRPPERSTARLQVHAGRIQGCPAEGGHRAVSTARLPTLRSAPAGARRDPTFDRHANHRPPNRALLVPAFWY